MIAEEGTGMPITRKSIYRAIPFLGENLILLERWDSLMWNSQRNTKKKLYIASCYIQ